MPQDKPKLSDNELALSMFVFIEQHGERMIKATADACRMVAEKSRKELDGTSALVWEKAGAWIDQAHSHLEEN